MRSDQSMGVNTALPRMIAHPTLQRTAKTKPGRRLQMKRTSMIRPKPSVPRTKSVAELPWSDKRVPNSNSMSAPPSEVTMAKNATVVDSQTAQRMKGTALILLVVLLATFSFTSSFPLARINQLEDAKMKAIPKEIPQNSEGAEPSG